MKPGSRAASAIGPSSEGPHRGYEVDVFISYTHIDNAPLVPGEQGWIANLHHALAARLPQLVGGEVRIWRDPKLDGNDTIGGTLVDTLSRAAVMIAVLSPRYIRSEWCQMEVQTFTRLCSERPTPGLANKSRVFKVIKTPVPCEQQPSQLRDLLGYEFFALDPHSQRPKEFRQDTGPNKDQRYWDRVEDLAYEIAQMVMRLRDESAPAMSVDRPPVYLAPTSSDLSDAYDQMRRELQQRGYPVLPDQPLPTVAQDLEAAVCGYLERSRLVVHLVGCRYGLVPEGTEYSVSELQNAIAARRAGEQGLARVIWIPQGLEPEDERQRGFIRRLETDSAAQAHADLLRTELGELKRVVLNLIEPPVQAGSAQGSPGTCEVLPRDIYLVYAPEDFDAAAPLEEALFDSGYELLTPLIDADGNEDVTEHEANLRDCEAVVLFLANGSEQWLRERLRELEQIPDELPRAIYLTGPETPRKQRFRTHRAKVVKHFGDFVPAALPPLLAGLCRADASEEGV